ncbi:MAG TPA: hypothetical protein VEW42_05385 [Candidatus Eisenbacteria bacterium]|nr:hypothetical protein [Candidatus Eisenbacteria bacterium]
MASDRFKYFEVEYHSNAEITETPVTREEAEKILDTPRSPGGGVVVVDTANGAARRVERVTILTGYRRDKYGGPIPLRKDVTRFSPWRAPKTS